MRVSGGFCFLSTPLLSRARAVVPLDKRGQVREKTYIREEDAGNAAPAVQALLVSLSSIVAASQAPLVARDRVLMRLDAAVVALAKLAQALRVVLLELGPLLLPAEGKVAGGHDLDEVHKVEVGVVRLLLGPVQGISVVVGPGQAAGAELLGEVGRELGAKAQRVDDVGKGVAAGDRRLPVVLEIVHVHVSVAKGPARSHVEVADDLVDAQIALDPASLLALLLEAL